MEKDKEKKDSKAAPEAAQEAAPETTPETTPDVKSLNENLEDEKKEDQEEKAHEINIQGATKLENDFEVPNVVFFKVNKPLGEAAYKLLEDRVDALNQKHADKLTIILVPFSVNVEQE